MPAAKDKPERSYVLNVIFSLHCFTRGCREGEEIAPNLAFQWLVVDARQTTFKDFEKPFDFIHKNSGAYLVWVLILGHAAAPLYHHYALRDATLVRMLPAKAAASEGAMRREGDAQAR